MYSYNESQRPRNRVVQPSDNLRGSFPTNQHCHRVNQRNNRSLEHQNIGDDCECNRQFYQEYQLLHQTLGKEADIGPQRESATES